MPVVTRTWADGLALVPAAPRHVLAHAEHLPDGAASMTIDEGYVDF